VDNLTIQVVILLEAARNNKLLSRFEETTDSDNTNRVFRRLNQNGQELAADTYFYKIVFSSGLEAKTGFLSLRK
jgi:hypothetical protein